MDTNVRRIYVEKKPEFAVEAHSLFRDLKQNLNISGLTKVRIINRYDIAGISDLEYQNSRPIIFAEPPVDLVYDEEIAFDPKAKVLAIEYLPGQYDQRADSAAQCIQILTQHERPDLRVAKLIVFEGEINNVEYENIKKYCLNPLESREASLQKPTTLESIIEYPADVPVIKDFMTLSLPVLQTMRNEMGLAMSQADLEFCRNYFRDTEQRNPTVTEIRVLDTYWSDHCRHTTFLTRIEAVEIETGKYSKAITQAYNYYLQSKRDLYGDNPKATSLMDLATIAMKELKRRQLLPDLDLSEEINACSIMVEVDVNGTKEDWLVQFKNETHNHPTEIEPFGGAATCLGGAIRDPLSGRSYVYQALRVTGSGDPRTKIADTVPGKLPQRKITTGAATGFSSYGNQIGLATGQVAEVYDEGFVAKRMEIGAVIGAVPKQDVIRQEPEAGDVVILLGGRTGRDGCGGATGSSKEHNEDSLLTCGAEVQKGNPPTERKIQRFFRNPKVSRIIKRCNDFGAGGVAVAIGELADGLEINLDAVPKKYDGLDGTELAISESQERMAVLIAPENREVFIAAAGLENLEATLVATVTEAARLKMFWRGKPIVDINRAFLNTNGVEQKTTVAITAPDPQADFFNRIPSELLGSAMDLGQDWLINLQRLNVCSQKGLVEKFDSTIGAGTVLLPFGGKLQLTPAESMAAKIPVLDGETTTGTLMSFGFNPSIGRWSPFHGSVYAIVEAIAKIVATGGNYKTIRLTQQEYFEKLGQDPKLWGKPFAALLGAFQVQMELGIPAIGGKDSMSGTFKDLTVPPTLVAFAVDVVAVNKIVSPEFKTRGSQVVLIPLGRDANELPAYGELKRNYSRIHELIRQGEVLAAHSVRTGGLAETITKMCFGNNIGFNFLEKVTPFDLFAPEYGSVVLELSATANVSLLCAGIRYRHLGVTTEEPEIAVNGIKIDLATALAKWEEPLEKIFPTRIEAVTKNCPTFSFERRNSTKPGLSMSTPRVFIPVFPGTNCEYDSAKAFKRVGARVETFVFRNLTPSDIEDSITAIVRAITNSQIIMFPGGFSAGDEPDGSGKFIATAFRNPYVKEAVLKLIKERDGLILGICNGFQALVKLGLVPYGEIREITADCPTLTYNTIGRHVSCMVETKVVSVLSPWFNNVKVGDTHTIAVSHGEGRFIANPNQLERMEQNGQIATQYIDLAGNPSYDIRYNPNSSHAAIEGITSPDGRVFGKMGHSERIGQNVACNVPGAKDQKLFEAGIAYFK